MLVMSRSPRFASTLSFILLCVVSTGAQALQFATGGPLGAPAYPPTTALAVSPSAPQVVYVAAGGSLYRSSDGGQTWLARGAPSSNAIDVLATDPANADVVYAVSARWPYRSDDGGATWKQLTSGVPTSGFLPVALRVDPRTSSTVYVGSRCGSLTYHDGSGVYKSTDRGETWTHSPPAQQAGECVEELALDPISPQHLYSSVTNSPQWQSSDGGATWAMTLQPVPSGDVVTDPTDPSRRYGIATSTAMGGFRFLVSSDSGMSWSPLAGHGLPATGAGLAVDPVSGRLFLAGGSAGLFHSDDGGAHWTHMNGDPAATSLAITGGRLFVVGGGGLYLGAITTESVTQRQIGGPAPRPLLMFDMALDPHDATTLFATGLEGLGTVNLDRVFRSSDSGRTWERITNDSDGTLRERPVVDAIGDLYAGGSGVMWRFAKASQTWESWSGPLFEPKQLLANPQRAGWLYAIDTSLAVYSADGGHDWYPMIAVTGFTTMSIAPNGNDVYAGNSDGVFASSDGGVTWRHLGSTALPAAGIAVAPSRPTTIYRMANAGVDRPAALFRSDDGGASWIGLHWPGESNIPQALTVDPRDERSLWIGLTHSTNSGVTWTTEPSNIPSGALHVTIDRDGTVLYATPSNYAGVWTATLRGNHRRAAGH